MTNDDNIDGIQPKYEAIRSKFINQVEKCVRMLGNLIVNRTLWFAVLPFVTGLMFLIVLLYLPHASTGKNLYIPSVKEMFLPKYNQVTEIEDFEQKWFQDTAIKIGNSRHSAHILIETKNGENVLSDAVVKDILNLHKFITEIFVNDSLYNNNIVTYRDICAKISNEDDNESDVSKKFHCAVDPVLDFMECTTKATSFVFVAEMDLNTEAVSGSLIHSSFEHNFDFKPFGFTADCSKLEHIKLSMDRTIGQIDKNVGTTFVSAQALRIFYVFSARTANEVTKLRSWLHEFERKIRMFHSDHFNQIAFSTESLDIEWDNLVNFHFHEGLFLCCIAFLILLIVSTISNNVFFGFYTAFCGSATLVMVLICTRACILLIYNRPTFNVTLCCTIISVTQVRFQTVFVKNYSKQKRSQREDSLSNCNRQFVDSYKNTFLTNFGFWILISLGFSTMTIPGTLPALHDMCVSCCIGFFCSFLYQVTLFSTCVMIYENNIRGCANRFSIGCCLFGINGKNIQSLDSDSSMEERTTESTQENNQRIKKVVASKCQKFKKLLLSLSQFYAENLVRDYMRAVISIIYLTYLSFCYVGCLHLVQEISPEQLISVKSNAFEYYQKANKYFEPNGPYFVVMGQFVGNPWEEKVVKELLSIDKKLLQVTAVDDKASNNWFQSYFKILLKNDEALMQQNDPSDGYDDSTYNEEDMSNENPKNDHDVSSLYDKIAFYDEFWISTDLKSAWDNFTQSEAYIDLYQSDIIAPELNSSLFHSTVNTQQWRFRWIFHTENLTMPGQQETLLASIQHILRDVNSEIVTLCYADAPEFDWWRNINTNEYLHSFVLLFTFGCITIVTAIIVFKSVLIICWSIGTAISSTFGICGIISFFNAALDPFTLPCIVFSLLYSVIGVQYMLEIFFNGSGKGRAKWAQIALRQSAGEVVLCDAVLLLVSLVLCFSSNYMNLSPLITLISLCFVTSLHGFVFLPVLLTISPPSKKEPQNVLGKPPLSRAGTINSEEVYPDTDSRPHLHARRYFYDSQRAASFRSEEDENRVEHVTCV